MGELTTLDLEDFAELPELFRDEGSDPDECCVPSGTILTATYLIILKICHWNPSILLLSVKKLSAHAKKTPTKADRVNVILVDYTQKDTELWSSRKREVFAKPQIQVKSELKHFE